mgnify:CR=1 FL=1
MIRCQIRKKWVLDTPEERVRQRLIAWLTEDRRVSPLAIGVEVSMSTLSPTATGRADLIVRRADSGTGGDFWLLGECKAPGKLLEDAAAVQVGRYLDQLSVDWLLFADEREMKLWKRIEDCWVPEENLPLWNS